MSRKRDRNRSGGYECSNCQNKSGKLNNGLGNNPFGINPSQLMGMLGNIDMGQIGNILSSMNRDGFDLNNLNLGSMQNMMSGINGNQQNYGNNGNNHMSEMGINENQMGYSIQEMMKNIGNIQGNNINNQGNMNGGNTKNNSVENKRKRKNENITNSKEDENITNLKEDENIEMLMSIRKIVNPNKVKFIDKVIELYNTGAFEE